MRLSQKAVEVNTVYHFDSLAATLAANRYLGPHYLADLFWQSESLDNGVEKKEKVKQMIKTALPDEQWKTDPKFLSFILDVLIDLVVILLNKGLWKTVIKKGRGCLRWRGLESFSELPIPISYEPIRRSGFAVQSPEYSALP